MNPADNLARRMLTRPWVRDFVWRNAYAALARLIPAERHIFLNYGYATEGTSSLGVEASGEALYERVAAFPCEGRKILEVGCGRGGGATHLARSRAPTEMRGLDFSPASIAVARKNSVPGLAFDIGDAGALPYESERFDAVLNIESAHCYPDRPAFFREALRVLKPGGFFGFADLCPIQKLDELKEELAACRSEGAAWKILETEDLTPGVLRALAATAEEKERFLRDEFRGGLRSALHPILKPMLKNFAAVPGSPMYGRMERREIVYTRWKLEKVSAKT